MDNIDLKKIAEEAKANASIPLDETPTREARTNLDDQDDEMIMVTPVSTNRDHPHNAPPVLTSPVTKPVTPDMSVFSDVAPDKEAEIAANILGEKPAVHKITDEDLHAILPDLDPAAFAEHSAALKKELDAYHKRLVIDNGFTPEEAMTATKNRMAARAVEIEKDYLAKHPKLGVVEIDKKNANAVEFSDEERAKLTTAKAIKLIVVDNKELEHINLDNYDRKHKAEYVRTIDDALSKYSTVLPLYGDFCSFKGAQIIQLATAIQYKDDSLEETIAKKAALIYDRLIGGGLLQKYDENNKVVLAYKDFLNQFPYQDMDLALYAILVASSMELTTMEAECTSCLHKWNHEYNIKSLLRMKNTPEAIQARCDDIFKFKGNTDKLNELHVNHRGVQRYKSPITNNIYDVAYPSIAKAVNLMKQVDSTDEVMVYSAALAMYIAKLFVYNPAKDNYVDINDYEVDILLPTLQRVPDEDFKLLMNEINAQFHYIPSFVVEAQCPNCGTKNEYALSIQDLIFLRALESSTEIR